MKYSFDSRVRFSDLGENQKMTLNSIINYYQDCSNFQSEEIGLGFRELTKKGRAWFLSSWQICVDRYPEMGEKVRTATWAYDFRGFYGFRNFTMHTEEGELLSYANSLWVYMDINGGKPARLKKEDGILYEPEERFPMEYADRKLPMPEGSTREEAFVMRRHQLDFNHHVNNGEYIRMAQDYLPEGFEISQMRAEYKKQAVGGSCLTPWIHENEGIYTVALCNEDTEPYAVMEFK